ncbi:MAG: S46 family peptidase, partial [Gemmatimonadetes bacterium]|nr:S46 family peptidase [Gemmatimonadota bacterium]
QDPDDVRRRRAEQIEQRMDREAKSRDSTLTVEVIELYHGGQYSAYTFKRYNDVRLVMVPHLAIGAFGGDPDNFTYPRYNLDFAFYRVYGDDGRPLRTEQHFQWDEDGAAPGEPVFIIGNPGSTSRLQSVAELEFRRDVSDRYLLDFLRDRVAVLQAFADANPREADRLDLVNTIFSLQNSEKAYEGQLAGLENPGVLARRLKLQRTFRDSIMGDPGLRAEYGGIFEEMAGLQARKRQVAPAYGAFLALTAEGFSSATLHRALLAFQVLNARRRGTPDDALQGLRAQLRGIDDQPAALDRALMAARFRDFAELFGEDTPWVRQILQGRSPEAAAEAIHARTPLADSARAIPAVEDGALTMEDPAVQVVTAYLQTFAGFQQALSEVGAREEELAARLGRARLEVYGPAVPPDATFSIRLADGVVRGYAYNGTLAPTHTTFHGLYDRHYSHGLRYAAGEEHPWALPERWRTPPPDLDLSTPLNFVSTADIIGGNSGSPVVDRDLRVVGLVFDGNIESLPGDYIYLPELNRSVSVDVRGILEALDEVYGMEGLVRELVEGRVPR